MKTNGSDQDPALLSVSWFLGQESTTAPVYGLDAAQIVELTKRSKLQKIESVKAIVAALVVLALWSVFITLGYVVTMVFQLPQKLELPLAVRFIGLLIILSSLLLFVWLIEYRRPVEVLISSYATFTKMVKRVPLDERLDRTEPLVVKGPYRYVRHPLYAGVLLLASGLWLCFDYTSLLFTTLLFLVWFTFVVTPFEEKELGVIFGPDYEQYKRRVSKMFPMPRRSVRSKRSE